jgi:AcrR family transcriptional regulator
LIVLKKLVSPFGIAALKLLSQKDFTAISVSELCKTAGYSRNTFYTHFQDAQDYEFKVLENLTLGCVTAFLYFLDHPEKLTPEALKTFLAQDGYAILEVFVDSDQAFEPKPSAMKRADGSLFSPPLEDMAPFLPREELEKIMLIPLVDRES